MNFVGSNLAKVQQFIPCKFKCKRFALHFFSICCLKIILRSSPLWGLAFYSQPYETV